MKLASFLGILTVCGIATAGEITSRTILKSSSKAEKEPVLYSKSPQTTQLASSSSEPETILSVESKESPQAPKDKPSLNKKQKLIENIKDYSVKIVCVSSTSGYGTGWFLDYEIPKDKKYPTKWFIATNIHALDPCAFDGDPYGQNPKVKKASKDSPGIHLYRWESDGKEEEKLREDNKNFEEPEFWSSEEAKKYKSYEGLLPTARDAKSTSDEDWNKKKKEIQSMHIEIPNAKLLYSAIENLKDDEGNPIYSFKDFAVVEVDFPDERSARRMTEQVYNKKEDERIKFTGEVKENSQFYTAGFPGNSFNPYRPVGNYSSTKDRASQKWRCHALPRINIQYRDGISYFNRRCYYELDNFFSRKGSSGSMIVDEDGTLLGLHTLGSKCRKLSYVQPIRFKEKDCSSSSAYHCKSQPEYDLIGGSSSSYKKQLLEHLPNINTYLKQKYNWTNVSLS